MFLMYKEDAVVSFVEPKKTFNVTQPKISTLKVSDIDDNENEFDLKNHINTAIKGSTE